MPARPRNWGLIVLVLLGAGATFVLLRPSGRDDPVVAEPVSKAVESAPAAGVVPLSRPAVAVATERCTGQRLDVTESGKTREVCVTDVSTDQNGSVRSYRVAALQKPERWLRVDAVGAKVLSAAFGGLGTDSFRCVEAQCSGITIGSRDVQGVRTISLNQTFSNDAVRVSGQLKTVPEEQLAGLACTDQGVSITTSDSSSVSFCPKGGAGFEIDAGVKTYRFNNLDGESIRVAVDEADRVKRVEYHGESTLACRTPSCGVSISPPNSDGERTFTFAGTTLIETSKADRSAVMSGTLVLPQL